MGVAGHPILAKATTKAIFGGDRITPWPFGMAESQNLIFFYFLFFFHFGP